MSIGKGADFGPPEGKIKHVENGGLADVVPTLLKILGLPKPAEMAGRELV